RVAAPDRASPSAPARHRVAASSRGTRRSERRSSVAGPRHCPSPRGPPAAPGRNEPRACQPERQVRPHDYIDVGQIDRPAKGRRRVIMANIRVAAIQMRAKLGAVASNLSHAESLVREAFRRGAEWVILPEFFTSAGAFAPSMLSAWLPLEGPALELL